MIPPPRSFDRAPWILAMKLRGSTPPTSKKLPSVYAGFVNQSPCHPEVAQCALAALPRGRTERTEGSGRRKRDHRATVTSSAQILRPRCVHAREDLRGRTPPASKKLPVFMRVPWCYRNRGIDATRSCTPSPVATGEGGRRPDEGALVVHPRRQDRRTTRQSRRNHWCGCRDRVPSSGLQPPSPAAAGEGELA